MVVYTVTGFYPKWHGFHHGISVKTHPPAAEVWLLASPFLGSRFPTGGPFLGVKNAQNGATSERRNEREAFGKRPCGARLGWKKRRVRIKNTNPAVFGASVYG